MVHRPDSPARHHKASKRSAVRGGAAPVAASGESRLPARPTGEVDQQSTGRGFASIPKGPAPSAEAPPVDDELSPFVRFAPSSDQMHQEADRRRDDSLGLLAIIGGLLFMLASAAVVALAVLLVGLWVTTRNTGELAGGKDGMEHIRDTGLAEVGPARGGPGGPGPGPGPDDEELIATGPGPGPATLLIPPDALFFTVEINCPGGFRSRAKFKKGKATVYNVPHDERCTVTFQGSTYAKTYISGHQTKMCTQFDPNPVCRLRYTGQAPVRAGSAALRRRRWRASA